MGKEELGVVAGAGAGDGARHVPCRAAQMLAQPVLHPRSAAASAAALLRGGGVSSGEQGGEPAALVGARPDWRQKERELAHGGSESVPAIDDCAAVLSKESLRPSAL